MKIKQLTFREIMLEAENLQWINRNQLQIQVSGEESVQDTTERHQQLLLSLHLILFGSLRWIATLWQSRFLYNERYTKFY